MRLSSRPDAALPPYPELFSTAQAEAARGKENVGNTQAGEGRIGAKLMQAAADDDEDDDDTVWGFGAVDDALNDAA